jgi:hypothetical protein
MRFSYLRVKYGMLWTDLKDLRVPLRVGDVIILPGNAALSPDSSHSTLMIPQ